MGPEARRTDKSAGDWTFWSPNTYEARAVAASQPGLRGSSGLPAARWALPTIPSLAHQPSALSHPLIPGLHA